MFQFTVFCISIFFIITKRGVLLMEANQPIWIALQNKKTVTSEHYCCVLRLVRISIHLVAYEQPMLLPQLWHR